MLILGESESESELTAYGLSGGYRYRGRSLWPLCVSTVCPTLDLSATLVAARHEASQRNRHRHTFFARGLGTRRRVPLALRPRRPTRRAHEAHKHKPLKPAISKSTGDWPLAKPTR
eukprot:scaffold10597_cov124-Isochrysis_galbana.AAC.9